MMARPAPRRHRRPFVPGPERITDHFGPADSHADIEKKEFVAASAQRSWALNRCKIAVESAKIEGKSLSEALSGTHIDLSSMQKLLGK